MPGLFRFNYAVSGKTNKPKILFLHGFMGSLDDWKTQKKNLSSDFRCIFLDLPGHGRTEVRDRSGYDFVKCAEGIVNFLKEKQFDPVNIVGYSLGGRIALYIATYWPVQVLRLVLESASPGIATKKDRVERVLQDSGLADRIKSEWPEFIENWYRQPVFHDLFKSPGFSQMIERKKMNNPEKLAHVLEGMGQGSQPHLWEKLGKIPMPVLLLAGELDAKYKNITEKMEKAIPDCVQRVIPGCSHNIHLQNPLQFDLEIRSFISSAPTQS